MDEKDVSNFTSSSSHRLPTVSASQALQKLASSRQLGISTGLPQLDDLLQDRALLQRDQYDSTGGLSRGKVTEIYGPPGVGKTTMAMQAAAGTLHAGNSVVWIDTTHTIVRPRFTKILSGYKFPNDYEPPSSPPIARSVNELLNRVHHFTMPSLPHLLTLLSNSLIAFPPHKTSLLIIDSVSSLLSTAFPRAVEAYEDKKNHAKKTDTVQWAASRKWSVMAELIARLNKLAAIHDIAVLLISQTVSRVRVETGAVLYPAITMKAWDVGITSRVVLFRNWLPRIGDVDQEKHAQGVRFAAVIKAGGLSRDGLGVVVSFTIEKHGLRDITNYLGDVRTADMATIAVPQLKRKRDQVANSESEEEDDFGWEGDDDPLTSEDLLDDNVNEHDV